MRNNVFRVIRRRAFSPRSVLPFRAPGPGTEQAHAVDKKSTSTPVLVAVLVRAVDRTHHSRRHQPTRRIGLRRRDQHDAISGHGLAPRSGHNHPVGILSRRQRVRPPVDEHQPLRRRADTFGRPFRSGDRPVRIGIFRRRGVLVTFARVKLLRSRRLNGRARVDPHDEWMRVTTVVRIVIFNYVLCF